MLAGASADRRQLQKKDVSTACDYETTANKSTQTSYACEDKEGFT